MVEANDPPSSWTEADTDALFTTLGKYWIIFQWTEGQLDQILQLGWGHENWDASHEKLVDMKNYAKIEAVSEMVLTSPDLHECIPGLNGLPVSIPSSRACIRSASGAMTSFTHKFCLILPTGGLGRR
jgi:hypothetical protein